MLRISEPKEEKNKDNFLGASVNWRKSEFLIEERMEVLLFALRHTLYDIWMTQYM